MSWKDMELYDIYIELSKKTNKSEKPVHSLNDVPVPACEDAPSCVDESDSSIKQDEKPASTSEYADRINLTFKGKNTTAIKSRFLISTDITNQALFWNMYHEVTAGASKAEVHAINANNNLIDCPKILIQNNLDNWIEHDAIIGFFDDEKTFLGCICLSDYVTPIPDIPTGYQVCISETKVFIRNTGLAESIGKVLKQAYEALRIENNPDDDYNPTSIQNDDGDSLKMMSLEALFFMVLDNDIPSVDNLLTIYPFESKNDLLAFRHIPLTASNVKKYEFDEEVIIEQCEKNWKSVLFEEDVDKYVSILKRVMDELREYAPKKTTGPLKEIDFYVDSSREHICEVCGEKIERGERAYFRSLPAKAIRHATCNSKVRYGHEYAIIDYLVKEIEFFESTFVNEENCDYILDGELTHNSFKKSGFITDKNNVVTRLPRFSEFVMDYISGETDYELMKKYRPYHVYLEFLLKMKGLTNEDLKKLGGYKYLMRENAGREKHPELAAKLDNIHQSELFWDEYTYNAVDSEVKKIIYESIAEMIFSEMGIRKGEKQIIFNDEMKSYSINEIDDSEISITIDSDGIYCTDTSSSLPFIEYFQIESETIKQMVEYMSSFEVKQ